MTNEPECCQRLTQGGTSPFEVAILGWHDGLMSGMAKCRGCGRTYHFDLLAWDEEQEARLYGFKEVSVASYDAVTLLLAKVPPSPARAGEFADLVTLRVRDAVATGMERKLLVLATDLKTFIQAAGMVEFAGWKTLLGTT